MKKIMMLAVAGSIFLSSSMSTIYGGNAYNDTNQSNIHTSSSLYVREMTYEEAKRLFGDEIFEPYTTSWLEIDRILNSATGSYTATFNTHSNFRYFRVFIHNTSGARYDVTIRDSGNIFGFNVNSWTGSVQSGNILLVANNAPWHTGTNTVSMTSLDGRTITGRLAVRISDTALPVNGVTNP